MTGSNVHQDPFDALSPQEMLVVNQACDEFENQWRETQNASIGEFASRLQLDSAAITKAVLCELVVIDAAYRRKHQMDVTLASYHNDFPQLREETLTELLASPQAKLSTRQTATSESPPDFRNRPVLANGQRVGDYLIERQIGQGGMGQVYRATHELMGRKVAIKVRSHSIMGNPTATQRFQREVQLLAGMQHPNVVSALDARHEADQLMLVTEWIDGHDLEELVQTSGAQSVTDVIEIAIQAAAGLHHAHVKGFIHRDVKPSNLMLDANGVIKILDLGLAKLHQDSDAISDDQVLTSTHQFIGTAAYLSPEQARNPARVDQRTDIYSLGCSLVFLLTGRPPYTGVTAMDTLLQHTSPEPIDLKRCLHPLSIPLSLARLIESMLEKDVERRPASMMEVRDELIRIREKSATDDVPSGRPFLRTSLAIAVLAAAGIFAVVIQTAPAHPDRSIAIVPSIPNSAEDAPEGIPAGVLFNGRSSYASVLDFDVSPEGSVMIDAWVTPDAGPLPSNMVTWGGENLLVLFIAPNLRWGVASLRNGKSRLQVSEEPFELGPTYRVTGQWANDEISLWIDGRSVGTRQETYQLYPSPVSLFFGGLPSGFLPPGQGTRYFSGRIHRLSLHRGHPLATHGDLPDQIDLASSTIVAFNLDQGAGHTVTSEDDRYRANMLP